MTPIPAVPTSDFYVGSCAGVGTQEPTIQAAVNAAATGNTVYVCPGTYNEAVSISKNITLLGAQYGVDASNPAARTIAAGESIIVAPLDSSGNAQAPVTYGSVGGTLNGFTLSGTASSHTDGNAAAAAIFGLNGNGGSSWTWTDNILTGNGEGMQFNTATGLSTYNAAQPRTVVSGNRFDHNNNNQSDPRSGSGIFNTNGVLNNTTITGNLFLDNGNSGPNANGDINTTGDGCSNATDDTAYAHGDVISNNTATHDVGFEDNFLVLFCTKGLQVSGNTVTYTTATDPNADSDIYVSGGNYDAVFTNNTLTGGLAKGFNLNTQFYGGSTGIQITNNTISGRSNGVYVTGGDTSYSVSGNTITGSSNDGLFVDGATGTGTFTGNTASGSTHLDCEDNTSGSGTLGTADTWTGDIGATSSPAGICSANAGAALPEVPMAALLPITALAIAGGTVFFRRRRAA